MKPTNEQIAEHLKKMGKHLLGTEIALNSVAFSVAELYEFIATRMPAMPESERKIWKAGARKALNSQNRAKDEIEELRREIDTFSRL